MNQESAFLEAIRAEPDEDVHRLAYADWLSEQADSAQRDRGEFIRVQCQLAKPEGGEPSRYALMLRESELLDRYRVEWTDRAFVRWLRGHTKKTCGNPKGHRFCQLMARGIAAAKDSEALPEGHPGRKRLKKIIDRAGKAIDQEFNYYDCTVTAPLFDQVTFRRGFIDKAWVQEYMVDLFAEAMFDLSPVLTELEIDDESGAHIGDNVIAGLVRAMDRAPALRVLSVGCPSQTTDAIRDFATCPAIRTLRSLHLWLPEGEENEALGVLASSPYLATLESLSVCCFGDLDDRGLGAVLDSPYLDRLTRFRFDCEETHFSPEMQARYEARFAKDV